MGADGGLLIAFEGIDGCGKSTQARALVERLTAAGRAARLLREPGGTDFGERVRELLLHGDEITPVTETLLYMASRAELYSRAIEPALAAGEVVVLDRTHHSTAAYQGAGLGLPEDWILALAREATGGREPDRVVLLELDVDAALARVASGEGEADRIERRGRAYFARVAEAYGRYAAAEPGRWLVVPADDAAEVVTRAVEAALAEALPEVGR